MQSIIFTLYTKLARTNEEKQVNKPATNSIKTTKHNCVFTVASSKGADKKRNKK